MPNKRKKTRGNSLTESFNVRLERQIIAELRVRAKAEHRTMTNLVQLFVSQGLSNAVMQQRTT